MKRRRPAQKPQLRLRKALAGYGPSLEHDFDPQTETCTVCRRTREDEEEGPHYDCIPKLW